MIDASDLRIAAFALEWEGYFCRACAVDKLGEATVARIEAGLCAGVPEWRPAPVYEVNESATDRGYECFDLDPDEHDVGESGFCEVCGEERCFECGKRLDTWDEIEAAA